MGEAVAQSVPFLRRKLRLLNKAVVRAAAQIVLVHRITTNKDNLLPPVPPDGVKLVGNRRAPFIILRPQILRHR